MDELDVNPRILNAVKKARLKDYGTVLSLSAPDLQRATQLSLNDIKQLHTAVATAVQKTSHTTALALQNKMCPDQLIRNNLTTGCTVLDSFLRGGFLSQTLTEIAGESASGKTQLCMQLCLTVQLPKQLGGLESGAVYICTEDVFPNKRLMQMATLLKQRCSESKVKAMNFTDNIFIEHAAETDDLWFCISKKIPILLAQGRIKLVILDSIAALFRCNYDSQSMHSRAKQMRQFASQLLKLATQYNIPVICVNQVSDLVSNTQTSSISGRKVIPALGIAWANLVTVRLMLTRTNRSVQIPQKDLRGNTIGSADTIIRTMEVLFAPHLPNTICNYVVDHDGVKGLPVLS